MNSAGSSSSTTSSTPRYHAVRFYENDKSLARIVAEFLADGLRANKPALVVASPVQRAGIVRELVSRGIDVVKVQENGNLLLADAEQMLSTFMKDGMPDADAFNRSMCELIKRVCGDSTTRTINIYGQMVDVLWQIGKRDAAIRLEMLWNQLAQTSAFSLLCGYAMGNFYKDAGLDDICSHHTHVIADDGTSNSPGANRVEGRP
jgi:hypothetical protein